MSRETRERVAQCEEAITHLTRRLEALEARSPGHYAPEPRNPPAMWTAPYPEARGIPMETPKYPPGYPYPFGGTTDEED